MALVHVGQEPLQQSFHLHKQLLAQASDYFDRALNGDFKESAGTLVLKHHCPIAFEAVYQWLYSGQKPEADRFESFEDISKFYHDDDIWHQLFYLRLFSLADETMIVDLKIHAYDTLTKRFFPKGPSAMPETNFLKELFETDTPLTLLQEYLVDYAAWIISNRVAKDPGVWAAAFREVPLYGASVLQTITIHANTSLDVTKALQHPYQNPKFATGRLAASPKEQDSHE